MPDERTPSLQELIRSVALRKENNPSINALLTTALGHLEQEDYGNAWIIMNRIECEFYVWGPDGDALAQIVCEFIEEQWRAKMKTLTWKNLKDEVMLDWDQGDRFGCAMHWFFGLVEVLYDRNDADIPAEWKFRPGLGGTDTQSFAYQACAWYDSKLLLRLGHALDRIVRFCRYKGWDY